ncbi:endonuclease MutS2 [Bittarella massiliensis (ex Durand et al. 2017)]|uniref:Endonuclease MutS2 n=1 Tax=Bittarella massiliensis (ex Durand et al. 2017) TaxID=1720313 RepID=A0ABW9WSZ4_9FIRM|nr:endonuclease MutS2 [Bittarella massiliensis (ex Durand et al. 2017)]MZL68649.1 endonuclease MutS2 [Bittarella massiliensis (ex Durand et al. 2017)]MZL79296.1 endonuclease MutS2 [Bittarella massiliensis (ex Durand et al. 2017)]
MNAEKHYKTLEFDKILLQLQKKTFCEKNETLSFEDLLCPSADEAREALARTDEMYTLLLRYGDPGVGRMSDLSRPLTRADKGGVLSIKELLGVRKLLGACRTVQDWYQNSRQVGSGLLDPYFAYLTFHDGIYRRLGDAILNEEELADSASPELHSIRRGILRAQNRAREKLEDILRSSSQQKYLQEALVTMRDGRFVLPVKSEFRTQVPGLVHDASQSGATLFVEPMAVVDLNNEVRMLRGKEQEEIERILQELTELVVSCKADLLADYDLLAAIDLLLAKAKLAKALDCTAPEMGDEQQIDLRGARHPLIAAGDVVPIDISLGRDFDTLVITGPNTGGKTVCLKTLGLFALMAKSGLLIPAKKGSRVDYFAHVYADIGDEQSIEQSLSTFSSHMVNIIGLLKEAGRGSLVLLDELGAGTDPTEGAALAIAVLEHLRAARCRTAASTHYAELKMYALKEPRVENASCEFDVESLRPTYRLIVGVPGRSNAFAIAGKLGMSRMVLDAARGYIQKDDIKFEDVIESLEQKRSELTRQLERAEQYAAKQKRQQEYAEKELYRQLKAAKQEAEEAHIAAQRVIEQTKREAEAVIAEIKERNRKKDAALTPGAVRNRVDKLYDVAGSQPQVDDHYTLPRPLKVGDVVTLREMNTPAEVVEIKGEDVTIQTGAIKTRVKMKDVRLSGKKMPKSGERSARRVAGSSQKTRRAALEIDLRGQSVDEAVMELDGFIDRAVLSGMEQISIIHGKGTGALRAGIHSYLKRHKNVAGFRLGTFGEGEAGVTIATLK